MMNMGWCSATRIFDTVANALFDEKQEHLSDKQLQALSVLADALEDNDWDCQCESAYWDHPDIGPLLGNTFEEVEGE